MDGSQVRVADWYAGKCVLVTGATGFVGKVVAEALLRKVPNISAILLLVRPNAKATPTQRFTELLASSIFDTLREQLGAEAFERLARTKMHPIAGDLVKPRMGMSAEDWTRLTSSVQVVLHNAATILFDEPLEAALMNNTFGALNVLNFAQVRCRWALVQMVSNLFSPELHQTRLLRALQHGLRQYDHYCASNGSRGSLPDT